MRKTLRGVHIPYIELYGCCLPDKVQSQQDYIWPVPFLDPTFQAAQRAGLDSHTHAFANRRRKTHLKPGLQRKHDVVQLLLEQFLVRNNQQPDHAIAA